MHGISDRDKLEVDIDPEELQFVVKDSASKKAPSIDGLSYEFYEITWGINKDTFRLVLKCQLNRLRIIQSDSMGVTRLIPKVVGTAKVDKLRPITLLNSYYKLLAKVLVRRMRPVMPQIIKSG